MEVADLIRVLGIAVEALSTRQAPESKQASCKVDMGVLHDRFAAGWEYFEHV